MVDRDGFCVAKPWLEGNDYTRFETSTGLHVATGYTRVAIGGRGPYIEFLPGHGVDQNPEDTITPRCEKGIRTNRFVSFMGCDRNKEILCAGEYSEWEDYPPLKIPLQDLFSFWWNRCVVQEYVVDEILEDIYDHFTEKMRPTQVELEPMDYTLDFDQISLFTTKGAIGPWLGTLVADDQKGTSRAIKIKEPHLQRMRLFNLEMCSFLKRDILFFIFLDRSKAHFCLDNFSAVL